MNFSLSQPLGNVCKEVGLIALLDDGGLKYHHKTPTIESFCLLAEIIGLSPWYARSECLQTHSVTNPHGLNITTSIMGRSRGICTQGIALGVPGANLPR